MLHGVIIDGVNTKDEYNLVLLQDVKKEYPALKTNKISIPGADGELDVSEYPSGEATFKNRNITFTLFSPVDDADLDSIEERFLNEYLGKNVKIILPDDLEHYYVGRMSIDAKSGYNSGKIKVKVDAEPYKYSVTETIFMYAMTTRGVTFNVRNDGRPVIPTITLSGDGTIEFNGVVYALSDGEHRILGFKLQPGDNEITVTGTGLITIKYREARF